MKNLYNDLDCYDENEIVEKCRKCESVTSIEEYETTCEIHKCKACGYMYKLFLNEEGDYDEENRKTIPSRKSKEFWE